MTSGFISRTTTAALFLTFPLFLTSQSCSPKHEIAEGGTGGTENVGGENGAGTGGLGGKNGSGGGTGTGTGGGEAVDCTKDADCSSLEEGCFRGACQDSTCVQASQPEGTACGAGECTADGVCDTCSTAEKDGDETDVDCGGSCVACADTLACLSGADCKSGVCTNNKCAASACSDGIKNGSETDVDCGGSCATKCLLGDSCSVSLDCRKDSDFRAFSVTCRENVCSNSDPVGLGDSNIVRAFYDFGGASDVRPSNPTNTQPYTFCPYNIADGVFGFCAYTNSSAASSWNYPAADGKATAMKSVQDNDRQASLIGYGYEPDSSQADCLLRYQSNLSLANHTKGTVMAWFKTAYTGASKAVVLKAYGNLVGVNNYVVSLANQRLSAQIGSSPALTDTVTNVSDDAWHHVAVSFDSSVGYSRFFIDGKKTDEDVHITALHATSGHFGIGCDPNTGTSSFDGLLDEVAILRVALSEAEVADYYDRSKPLP